VALMVRGESRIRREIRWAMLPYGIWECADGRKVAFNRRYRPIWQRDPAGTVSAADPSEFVVWCNEYHFYDDGTRGKAQRAISAFETFTGKCWDWNSAKEAFRNLDRRRLSAIWSESADRRARFRTYLGASIIGVTAQD
jgi:hypothetical protein